MHSLRQGRFPDTMLGDWSGAFPILPWWRKRQCANSFCGRECVISNSFLNKYALIPEEKECLYVQFVYAQIVHMCVSTYVHMCCLCTWRHQACIRSVPGFPPSPRQGLFNPELTDLRMLASQLTPKIWTFTFRTLEL